MTTINLNSSMISSFEIYHEDFLKCPSCGGEVSSVSSTEHDTVEMSRNCEYSYRFIVEGTEDDHKRCADLNSGCRSKLLKIDSIKYFNEGVDDEDQYFDLKQKAREQLQHNWSLAVSQTATSYMICTPLKHVKSNQKVILNIF